jgi:molybdopterin converting factor small subunit
VSKTQTIRVNVALYGPIARAVGAKHVARLDVELTNKATVGDLMEKLELEDQERGYLFVNAVLCDVPGLNVSRSYELQEGDHVGIFSKVHMWPYQYRDGARMSDALREALQETGAMHHSYTSRDNDQTSSK